MTGGISQGVFIYTKFEDFGIIRFLKLCCGQTHTDAAKRFTHTTPLGMSNNNTNQWALRESVNLRQGLKKFLHLEKLINLYEYNLSI